LTIGESFRKAFDVVGRNWPLVLINMACSIIALFGFYLMVILPLNLIFHQSGMEGFFISKMKLFEHTLSRLSFRSLLTVITFFTLWLFFVSALALYVYAGAVGVMKEALAGGQWRFSMKGFFRIANRLFFPLAGYLAVVLLIGIAAFVGVFGFAGLLVALVISFKTVPHGAMAVVVSVAGVFMVIVMILCILALILLLSALNAFGVSVIAFEDKGVFGTVRHVLRFLKHNPQAFWGYVFALGILMTATVVLGIVGLIINIVPLFSELFSLSYSLFSWSVQIYIGYWSVAVAMSFYSESRVNIMMESSR